MVSPRRRRRRRSSSSSGTADSDRVRAWNYGLVIIQRTYCARGHADTLAFKLRGQKPTALTIHPVLPSKDGTKKSKQELIYAAEEALGLVRAVNWQLLPGPTTPKGGWCQQEIDHVFKQMEAARIRRDRETKTGWHVDRGNESDEEFDLEDPRWTNNTFRPQLAESCLVRASNRDMPFAQFQLQRIASIYLQRPSSFVFINCILTPLQLRNFELFFANLLDSWKRGRDCLPALPTSMGDQDKPNKPEEGRGSFERNEYTHGNHPSHTTPTAVLSNSTIKLGKTACATLVVDDLFPTSELGLPGDVQVYDRHSLVLEIFALRAQTQQAMLQVELARARYVRGRLSPGTAAYDGQVFRLISNTIGESPKIKQLGSSNWTADFLGTSRGESFGNQQRRLMETSLKTIHQQMREVRRQRDRSRSGRAAVGTISLVGYTNSGKTMLMNRLTNNNLKVRNLLFQTLDTTCRRIKLCGESGYAVLVDSVGFIDDLPHSVYSAFQVTVDELVESDVLLHVRDMRHPCSEQQKVTVLKALAEAGMTSERMATNIVEVWNKVDLFTQEEMDDVMKRLPEHAVPISALDGGGCDILLQVLTDALLARKHRFHYDLRFPTSKALCRFVFLRRHMAAIRSESIRTSDDGRTTYVEVITDEQGLQKYWKEFGKE